MSPPQLGHARSASSRLNTRSIPGQSGCGVGPFLVRSARFFRSRSSARLFCSASARATASVSMLGLGLQRFEHLERELEIAGLAAEPLGLPTLRGNHVEELLDLRLLSLRDPAQLLDVVLAIQIERHDFLLII
jgi:hypothetical protein